MDPDTYLIDAADAAPSAAICGQRPGPIVPVHLLRPDRPPVERLRPGGRAGVAIVEDAAQCQGATRHGRGAGVGGIAATSFYPGKNLGAYGDAGAVVTDDEALATVVRTIGSHGGLRKYVHDVVGVNSRLDALQAVVLRAKLARLAGGTPPAGPPPPGTTSCSRRYRRGPAGDAAPATSTSGTSTSSGCRRERPRRRCWPS